MVDSNSGSNLIKKFLHLNKTSHAISQDSLILFLYYHCFVEWVNVLIPKNRTKRKRFDRKKTESDFQVGTDTKCTIIWLCTAMAVWEQSQTNFSHDDCQALYKCEFSAHKYTQMNVNVWLSRPNTCNKNDGDCVRARESFSTIWLDWICRACDNMNTNTPTLIILLSVFVMYLCTDVDATKSQRLLKLLRGSFCCFKCVYHLLANTFEALPYNTRTIYMLWKQVDNVVELEKNNKEYQNTQNSKRVYLFFVVQMIWRIDVNLAQIHYFHFGKTWLACGRLYRVGQIHLYERIWRKKNDEKVMALFTIPSLCTPTQLAKK